MPKAKGRGRNSLTEDREKPRGMESKRKQTLTGEREMLTKRRKRKTDLYRRQRILKGERKKGAPCGV